MIALAICVLLLLAMKTSSRLRRMQLSGMTLECLNTKVDGYRWGDVICGAQVQFGCYHHRDVYVYACRLLAVPLRVLIIVSVNSPLSTTLNLTLMYP